MQAVEEEEVCFAIDHEGNGGFFSLQDPVPVPWTPADSDSSGSVQLRRILSVLAFATVLCVLFFASALLPSLARKLKRKRHASLSEDILVEDADLWDKSPSQDASPHNMPPVVSVRSISMVFMLSNAAPSGIKEYLIQRLKGQVRYRPFTALDHVSFDIFKGEVVGIIGTNGSGKSTLLRLIAGTLNPSSGQIIVDRKKVQLLTLGTGFDPELSARENIYLNGSLIGYSKAFIDRHFEDIVDFAELRPFIDQKVKNFSSGMVSRLAFSIATAGEAAEILILDEVFAVGDASFVGKSLARIQNLIHSGSTVIMVSHSLGRILEHCSRAIWLEQGSIRLMGDPKTVCSAYQKEAKRKGAAS